MHRGCLSCGIVSSTVLQLTGTLWCQVEAELLPAGKDNPWGNAFVKKETDLVDESTSGRIVDCLKARFWKIKNPAVCHEYSGRVSMPMPLYTPLLHFPRVASMISNDPSKDVSRLCMKHMLLWEFWVVDSCILCYGCISWRGRYRVI